MTVHTKHVLMNDSGWILQYYSSQHGNVVVQMEDFNVQRSHTFMEAGVLLYL